jgi:hypothetical protein
MKHLFATGNRVLRAYSRSVKTLAEDPRVSSSSQSAGFIFPAGAPKGEGYQVFVTVERFSEARLKDKPESGGLF